MTMIHESDTPKFVYIYEIVWRASARRFDLHNQNGSEWPPAKLSQTIKLSTTERSRVYLNVSAGHRDSGMKSAPHLKTQNHAKACEFKQNHRAITRTLRTIAGTRNGLIRNYESFECRQETYPATHDDPPQVLKRPLIKLEGVPLLSVCYATKHEAHSRLVGGAMRERLSLSLSWLQLKMYSALRAAW